MKTSIFAIIVLLLTSCDQKIYKQEIPDGSKVIIKVNNYPGIVSYFNSMHNHYKIETFGLTGNLKYIDLTPDSIRKATDQEFEEAIEKNLKKFNIGLIK